MTPYLLIALLLIILAWMSWRYISLRRSVDAYTRTISRATKNDLSPRGLPTDIKNIESLSSAVHALISTLNLQLSIAEAERSRLAAILDQMTDGVLIADADGRIQLVNPAAEKLLGEGTSLTGRSVTVALRHHQ